MAERLAVLLVDDGELDDVQKILEEARLPFGRVRGGAIVPDSPPPKRLLIATPRRIEAIRPYDEERDGGEAPVRVVVVDGDSNTLRAKLREIGFDYLVRRPVHPEALRLLLLHCLYSGDERRSEPRVPVGYEISFKTGLLQRVATLVDLSTGGARLLSSYGLSPGKRIKIQIPEELGATEPLVMNGRVLRRDFHPEVGQSGLYAAAVAFEDVTPEQRRELEWILEERAQGPAVMGRAETASEDPRTESSRTRFDEHVRASRRPDPRVEPDPNQTQDMSWAPPAGAACDDGPLAGIPDEPPPRIDPLVPEEHEEQLGIPVAVRMEPEPPPELAPLDEAERTSQAAEAEEETDPADVTETVEDRVPQAAAGSPSDRRKGKRATYERKVPAFGTRALRVLVGRDLSRGGMRVEHLPDLEIGDRLHLAIYGDAGEEPFLVWATVSRDADDGMALVFDEVSKEVGDQLERLVATLPAVEDLNDGELGAMGTVVSEVLDS